MPATDPRLPALDRILIRWALVSAVLANVLLVVSLNGGREDEWTFYTPYSKMDWASVVQWTVPVWPWAAWGAALALGGVYIRLRGVRVWGRPAGRWLAVWALLLVPVPASTAWLFTSWFFGI